MFPLLPSRSHFSSCKRQEECKEKKESISGYFWKDCTIVNCRKQTNLEQKIEREYRILTRPTSWIVFAGCPWSRSACLFCSLEGEEKSIEKSPESYSIYWHPPAYCLSIPFLLFSFHLSPSVNAVFIGLNCDASYTETRRKRIAVGPFISFLVWLAWLSLAFLPSPLLLS